MGEGKGISVFSKGGMAAGVEQSSTPVVPDGETAGLSAGTVRGYASPFVMPAGSKFYEITGMSWYNGATVAGNVLMGLDKMENVTVPPTLTDGELVAYCANTPMAGASQVQKTTDITQTRPLGPGECVIPWFNPSNALATFKRKTVTSRNNARVITDSRTYPRWKPTTAWSATIFEYYLVVDFVGYS